MDKELITELSVTELRETIKEDSIVSVVSTYVESNQEGMERIRAVYRVDGKLYDSIHLFSNKVSQIEGNRFKFEMLEPNFMYKKEEGGLLETLDKAIKYASETQGESNQAVEAVMLLWNKIASDYVLVKKDEVKEDLHPESDSLDFSYSTHDSEFETIVSASQGDKECYRSLLNKETGVRFVKFYGMTCFSCGKKMEGSKMPIKINYMETFSLNCLCGKNLLTI